MTDNREGGFKTTKEHDLRNKLHFIMSEAVPPLCKVVIEENGSQQELLVYFNPHKTDELGDPQKVVAEVQKAGVVNLSYKAISIQSIVSIENVEKVTS